MGSRPRSFSSSPLSHRELIRGRPLTRRRAKLPNPSQPFEVARTRPHPPPPVSIRTEPSPGVRRPLTAVRGLKLSGVDHSPAAIRLGHEASAQLAGSRGLGLHVGRLTLTRDGYLQTGRIRAEHLISHLLPETGEGSHVLTCGRGGSPPEWLVSDWGCPPHRRRGIDRGLACFRLLPPDDRQTFGIRWTLLYRRPTRSRRHCSNPCRHERLVAL